MKMKGFVRKCITATLIAAMTVSAFTGCGKADKKDDKKDENSILNEAKSGSKDYVFKYEDIDLGVDKLPGYPSNITVVGDRVYFAVSDLKNDAGSTKVYSFNTDGSNVESYDIAMNAGENYYNFVFMEDGSSYACLSVGGNMETFGSGSEAADEGASEAATDSSSEDSGKEEAATESSKDEAAKEASKDEKADEKKAASESSSEDASASASSEGEKTEEHEEGMGYYEDEDAQMFLVKLDNKGNIVDKYDISQESGPDDYFNISSMIALKDGTVLVSDNRGIETYTVEGRFKNIFDITKQEGDLANSALTLIKGKDDQIFVQYYGESGIALRKFDVEKAQMSEESKIFAEDTSYRYGCSIFGGNGYDLYIANESCISGYDATKDEVVKLLDYIDSDIETDSTIYNVIALSENEFIALIPGFEYEYKAIRLTKVPADQVKDKKIITFGGAYIDYKVREQVVKFNHDNDEYKIKIVDYSKYDSEEDWNAGNKKFDLDIVSGNVPDIMVFNADQPIEKYQNKGVFLDLKPLFDKDEEMKKIELLPNISESMVKDGKMYTIYSEFMVGTLATRARYVEGKNGLTYKDCDDLIQANNVSYETAFGLSNKESILGEGIIFAGSKYMDFENKKCSFDSDGFIKLLEFANKFPDEVDYDKYEDYEQLYTSNQALFSVTSLYGYKEYQRYKQAMFKDDIAFVGLPNDEGENQTIIYPLSDFAISAQTQYPELAWKFVKSFLQDDYQTSMQFGFPVTKTGLEDAKKKAMERPYIMAGGEKEYYDDTYYIGNEEITLKPLTQEEVDFLTDFILSIDKFYRYSEEVHEIISEEAKAYFSGQKSAKEVADIIQSRLTIYINENS
ncbi:MAG: extracellular solute-binding protein [Butyrivibrio sp.]|nr:extracellular solute-binding protein [Butyrivibrio sp.]